VIQKNKQHETRENFCTKFCWFAAKKLGSGVLFRAIFVLTYAKMTQTQTSRTNFVTEQVGCNKVPRA